MKGEVLLFVTLSFAIFVLIFSQLKLKLSSNELIRKTFIDNRVLNLEIIHLFHPLIKLVVIGFIALILAYPLTFHGSVYDIDGRASRVHVGAAIGISIICASLCSAIMMTAKIYGQKNLVAAILATFFSLLVGFGLIVQHDYKLSWQYQRAFWTDLIELCPDLQKGTVILVEPTGLRKVKQIHSYAWPLPRILSQIYQFPDDWKSPQYSILDPSYQPKVYELKSGWKRRILSDKNLLQLDEFTTVKGKLPRTYLVESSNTIFIETKNRKLVRRTEPLIIKGQALSLKQKGDSVISSFDKRLLYKYLIKSSNEQSVSYLK